jgi:hypothetical protein
MLADTDIEQQGWMCGTWRLQNSQGYGHWLSGGRSSMVCMWQVLADTDNEQQR